MRIRVKGLLGDIYDPSYIDLLLKLRYGSIDISSNSHPVLNYSSIAKLLHRSESTIAHHCKLALNLRKLKL